jgi:hypothetical protein
LGGAEQADLQRGDQQGEAGPATDPAVLTRRRSWWNSTISTVDSEIEYALLEELPALV